MMPTTTQIPSGGPRRARNEVRSAGSSPPLNATKGMEHPRLNATQSLPVNLMQDGSRQVENQRGNRELLKPLNMACCRSDVDMDGKDCRSSPGSPMHVDGDGTGANSLERERSLSPPARSDSPLDMHECPPGCPTTNDFSEQPSQKYDFAATREQNRQHRKNRSSGDNVKQNDSQPAQRAQVAGSFDRLGPVFAYNAGSKEEEQERARMAAACEGLSSLCSQYHGSAYSRMKYGERGEHGPYLV